MERIQRTVKWKRCSVPGDPIPTKKTFLNKQLKKQRINSKSEKVMISHTSPDLIHSNIKNKESSNLLIWAVPSISFTSYFSSYIDIYLFPLFLHVRALKGIIIIILDLSLPNQREKKEGKKKNASFRKNCTYLLKKVGRPKERTDLFFSFIFPFLLVLVPQSLSFCPLPSFKNPFASLSLQTIYCQGMNRCTLLQQF